MPGATRSGSNQTRILTPFACGVVADGAEAAGEPPRIDLPRAHLRPAVLLDVPAGVHPPVVELEPFFQVAVDVHDLVLLVGANHLSVGPRAGGHELRRRQLAARPGHVMGHHPPPPKVLRAAVVAAPELQYHERAAYLFARMQLSMDQLLSGADADAAAGIADELAGPLARPADDDNRAPVALLEVEVGPVTVRRAAAGGGDPLGGPWLQRSFQRTIVRPACRRADGMVQQEFAVARALPRHVEREDLFQDWRVGGACVLEVKRPFDGGKVAVLDRLAADLKAGLRVDVLDGRAAAIGVDVLALCLPPPHREQLCGRLARIDERERQIGRRRLCRLSGQESLGGESADCVDLVARWAESVCPFRPGRGGQGQDRDAKVVPSCDCDYRVHVILAQPVLKWSTSWSNRS